MSREVLEFIIVPPYEQQQAVEAAKERLVAYLGQKFPGYTFKVGPFAPVGDEDDFCILPIMNFLGDNGQSVMCDTPKRWLISEIVAACRAFDLKGMRSFAA